MTWVLNKESIKFTGSSLTAKSTGPGVPDIHDILNTLPVYKTNLFSDACFHPLHLLFKLVIKLIHVFRMFLTCPVETNMCASDVQQKHLDFMNMYAFLNM